jgi:uncharacterized protein YbjT (DUF2867 family)
MRVLVIGPSGFIGSAVAAKLSALGHEIVGASRRAGSKSTTLAREFAIDVARATDPADWLAPLAGVSAVVNCAGVLQDSPRDSTSGVHIQGTGALYRACEQAGVRRVVHLSALGVERHTTTAFSRTKLAGDQSLAAHDLDWVILRPSVVVGRGAYGGSALIRALAALPFVPYIRQAGALQIVHLDDVVEVIVFFLRPDAPAHQTVEIVGPRRWQLHELVRTYRMWMRFGSAPTVSVPRWAASALFVLGDMTSLLGWRPPMRTTALREIEFGSTGDSTQLAQLGAPMPRDVTMLLTADPPTVQERWFARLYLLKPVVLGSLSLFWIITGVISLGPGFATGAQLLRQAGLTEFAGFGVVAGSVFDIAVGVGIAIRPLSRIALFAALGASLLYGLAGSILLPFLWADPLGALLKIGPVIALLLVALAILDDR